jgi:GNAT superfamily N-acetyltransferase
MHFRVSRGGKLWEEVKGAKNRKAMKALVESGEQRGCLAFAGDEPVGWVSIGPRQDYLRMNRSRIFKTPYDDGAWSIPCFYIKREWQRRGVSRLLLREAVRLFTSCGATKLLANPIVPSKGPGHTVPSVFAHTGFPQMYEREGFCDATPEGASRRIYLLAHL